MTTITLADIVKEEQEFLKSNTKMTSKEDSCMCPMIEGCYAIFDQSLEYIQKNCYNHSNKCEKYKE